MLRDYLGPPVADAQAPLMAESASLSAAEASSANHRVKASIGQFATSTTEPLLARALDTAAEMVARAEHFPAHAFGIAQAAERHRLQLDRAGSLRKLQGLLVLARGSSGVAAREEQVPVEEMDARLLGNQSCSSAFASARSRSAKAPSRSSVTLAVARPIQPRHCSAQLSAAFRAFRSRFGCRYRADSQRSP